MRRTVTIVTALVLAFSTAELAAADLTACYQLADPYAQRVCADDWSRRQMEAVDRESAARRERFQREAEAYDQERRIRELEQRLIDLERGAGADPRFGG